MNWKKLCTVSIAVLALGVGHVNARDLAEGEWYLRFILKSDTGGLEDSYNTIGQMSDALLGFDSYDLPELGQPWAGTYLSVIFYRPEFGTQVQTYNTDYHPVTAKTASDAWTFEVRSDDPARVLSLTWAGKKAPMRRMVLVDLQENVVVPAKVDGTKQVYHFTMNGAVREFAWRLLSNKEYKQFLATSKLPPDPAAVALTTSNVQAANKSGASLRTAAPATTSNGRKSSGWLPLGWGQGEGKGYSRENPPPGLPDDPFGN